MGERLSGKEIEYCFRQFMEYSLACVDDRLIGILQLTSRRIESDIDGAPDIDGVPSKIYMSVRYIVSQQPEITAAPELFIFDESHLFLEESLRSNCFYMLPEEYTEGSTSRIKLDEEVPEKVAAILLEWIEGKPDEAQSFMGYKESKGFMLSIVNQDIRNAFQALADKSDF